MGIIGGYHSLKEILSTHRWGYSVIFGTVGFLFTLIGQAIPYHFLSIAIFSIGMSLISFAIVMNLWDNIGGEPIVRKVAALDSNITELDKKISNCLRSSNKIILDGGLIDYSAHIHLQGSDYWYKLIEKADKRIFLMAPSLNAWFNDTNKMINLLANKAINGADIRIIFMASDNIAYEHMRLDKLPDNGEKVDRAFFYDKTRLLNNEDLLKTNLLSANRLIKNGTAISTPPNYIQAKRLGKTPFFLKIELFDDIIHWSFFGYTFDGQKAPSFLVEDIKPKPSSLYTMLSSEFDIVWTSPSISDDFDITP